MDKRQVIVVTSSVRHVFIIGAKGISFYGGFETFAAELLRGSCDMEEIRYYVACKKNGRGAMDLNSLEGLKKVDENHYLYMGALLSLVPVSEKLGAAQAILYDLDSVKRAVAYCKKCQIPRPVFYFLTCRLGLFLGQAVKEIHKIRGSVYLNPDGLEWKRGKWSLPVRLYWKFAEKKSVEHADMLVCDSEAIRKYITEKYSRFHPKTVFIPYGAVTETGAVLPEDQAAEKKWLDEHALSRGQYYLVVGRFVPENNVEVILREFMKSKSERKLALVMTKDEKYRRKLQEKLHFDTDPRICFAGTVYNIKLLQMIRSDAYAYIHGHSVGGTNPSLLESLAFTSLNLLYDVAFNRETALESGIYWTLKEGNLAGVIDLADRLPQEQVRRYGNRAKQRIREEYYWQKICAEYEKLWKEDPGRREAERQE